MSAAPNAITAITAITAVTKVTEATEASAVPAITASDLAAFHAAYARAIDSDALESWPAFFTEAGRYRITHAEDHAAGLPGGLVYADSRAMLEDRVAALREANIYERQRYRHILGWPHLMAADGHRAQAETPFVVVRTMHTGEQTVFASGVYIDRVVRAAADGLPAGPLLLAERLVVCDSSRTDTLLALPL